MSEQLSLWLSSVLPRGTRFELQPLAAAASFRRFYRVRSADGSTRIAMVAPAPLEDAERFVRLAHWFANAGVGVPRVLRTAAAQGWVLMSDVGEQDLQAAYAAGRTEAALQLAMDELHRIQAMPADGLPSYTTSRLSDELNLFDTWLVRRMLQRPSLPGWRESGHSLITRIERQPRCVVHRDYHCQNLLIDSAGGLGVVDFQDALTGPVLYDLASLLHDCYQRFPDAQVADALETYLRRTPFHISQPQLQLDSTALQRQLKALGIFARLWLRDHKKSHLRYISPVLEHAAHLAERCSEPGLAAGLSRLREQL